MATELHRFTALETDYLDYHSRAELLAIKNTVMNHQIQELIFLNGSPYRVIAIETEFDTDASTVRRSIFLMAVQGA